MRVNRNSSVFRTEFESEELNIFKGASITRGRRRRPDRRTVGQMGNNKRFIQTKKRFRRRKTIKMTENYTKNFSRFTTNKFNMGRPRQIRTQNDT